MSNWEPKLVLRRSPLPDELLSSWLTRTVKVYRSTPQRFTKLAFGEREVFETDVDANAPADLLALIDQVGLLTPGTARGLSLVDWVETIGVPRARGKLTPWLLASTITGTRSHRHSLQYCPQCLDDDLQRGSRWPYFRRRWRMGFTVHCPDHLTVMQDACPKCDAPIIPHQSPGMPMCLCWQCGADLRLAKPRLAFESRSLQGDMQAALDNPDSIDRHGTTSQDYLRGLRTLLTFLMSPRITRKLAQHRLWTTDHTDVLERNRIEVRYLQMTLLQTVTDEWPHKFVKTCELLGLTASDVADLGSHSQWLRVGMDAVREAGLIARPRQLPAQAQRQGGPDSRTVILLSELLEDDIPF
jgi:hypothetical protein